MFHLVSLNLRGEAVIRKKCSRTQLLQFTANIQVNLIGMETCAGAHFLVRALRDQGHEGADHPSPSTSAIREDEQERLYIDAEAIAEAVGRPTMRFVPIQTDDQLYMQSLHRVRERWVIRRTAVGQPDPGPLLERGITLRQGRRHLEAALPEILEDTTAKLSGALRVLISQLKHELEELANFNRGGWKRGCLPERSRVLSLGGYGARESSTGGKQKLMGISKRGNPYLRKLLIQGVRAVMLRGTKQSEHGSRTSLCGSTIMSQRWLLRTKWPESPGSFWDRRSLSTLSAY